MASNFIGPRMCPWLLVALTQTPFVWAVRCILLDHEDKLFCRWLLSMLIYQVSIFGRCSLQPNKFRWWSIYSCPLVDPENRRVRL